MAVRWLHRLAAALPAPVFAAVGAGAREAVQDLMLCPEVEVVATPRHAAVLLVAGRIPPLLEAPVSQVHDQIPAPRATVHWPDGKPARDAASVIASTHRDLLTGSRQTEKIRRPDRPPTPWQGVGPYGQGGEGMTAGTPYGRPMAMTAPDRDGLELDQLSFWVGPFFAPFPPGLALHVAVQGDVIQEARPADNPFAGAAVAPAPVRDRSLVEFELARARRYLRWVAHALRVQGLEALAVRTLGVAQGLDQASAAKVGRLRRLLTGNPGLRDALRGVGRIPKDRLAALPPCSVARAAGLARDSRLDDSAYAALGFEAVTHDGGDAWARLLQRIAEAEQSVELARLAGSMKLAAESVEAPEGESTSALLGLLPALLPGMEWGDAVTTVVSLDLDLEQAAAQERLEVG